MNLVFSHGDKGGVGKSTALIWLIENHIANERGEFAIIETDPKIRDVGDRYKNHFAVAYAPLEVESETDALEGINRLFETAANLDKPTVFVNLPAAASLRLDPNSGLLAESFRDAGMSMRVAFVADDKRHSKALLEQSVASGVMGKADRSALILNGNFGPKPESWPVIQTDAKIGEAAVMRKINDFIWRSMSQYAAPLSVMMPELNALHKNIMRGWIKDADKIGAYLAS